MARSITRYDLCVYQLNLLTVLKRIMNLVGIYSSIEIDVK